MLKSVYLARSNECSSSFFDSVYDFFFKKHIKINYHNKEDCYSSSLVKESDVVIILLDKDKENYIGKGIYTIIQQAESLEKNIVFLTHDKKITFKYKYKLEEDNLNFKKYASLRLDDTSYMLESFLEYLKFKVKDTVNVITPTKKICLETKVDSPKRKLLL